MFYVIQVPTNQEAEFIRRIKFATRNTNLLEDIFSPKQTRIRKLHGEIFDYEATVFPGYLFVKTDKPEELNTKLYQVEGFTRLLGNFDKSHKTFLPLTAREEELILHLIGQGHTIDVSKVHVHEGKIIRVIDGPLYGLEGTVVKVNLHKRVAVVRTTLASQGVDIHLGIDIIREQDDGTV